MEAKGAVEAALFSSAEGLRVKEIADRTGLSEEAVRSAVKALIREYNSRGSALTVVKVGPEYTLQLRSEYTDFAGEFSSVELARGVQRTLSTIAYNQPVLQSELCRNLGSRVYDDVRELIGAGLVAGRRSGQTLELTTTKRFSEAYGINGCRPEDVRRWIDSKRQRRRRPRRAWHMPPRPRRAGRARLAPANLYNRPGSCTADNHGHAHSIA